MVGTRPVLAPVLLLLFCGTAPCQISFIQATANASSGSVNSFSTSFSANTQAGDLILVGFDIMPNGTVISVTDSQGNSFTEVGSPLTSSGGTTSRVYYANNTKGGADSITITLSTSSNFEVYLSEYSGVNQVNPIDGQSGASGSAGTVSSGNVTTTAAGDLIYGYCVGDFVCTAGSGLTARSTFHNNLVEDMIAGSPGGYAASGSANSGWTMQMVALMAASSTVSSSTPLNACDLAPPFGVVNSADVTAAINMTLGTTPCTASVVSTDVCNVVVVQRVVDAALGGTCVTGSTVAHSVSLTWGTSGTANATYNIYRATTSGGYAGSPLASAGTATSFTDNAVQSGQTYYYAVTAVSGGNESARSNEVSAAVPSP